VSELDNYLFVKEIWTKTSVSTLLPLAVLRLASRASHSALAQDAPKAAKKGIKLYEK